MKESHVSNSSPETVVRSQPRRIGLMRDFLSVWLAVTPLLETERVSIRLPGYGFQTSRTVFCTTIIYRARQGLCMTDNGPDSNNPLSPYYPSETPRISGNGRKWFVILILLMILFTVVNRIFSLVASLQGWSERVGF